jgi:diguanylate cyclase (GGDEF)-like protein
MSVVVDHLAELTAYRDRDLLDATLAGALRDLLSPVEVAIYRPVGEPGTQVWLMRARLAAGDRAAASDSPFTDPAALPPLEAHPLRVACTRDQEPRFHAGPPAVAVFPVVSEREESGVVEVTTAVPLTAEQARVVGSVLRIVRNIESLLDYGERDTLTGLLNRKTFDETFLRSTGHLARHAGDADAAAGASPARRGACEAGPWLAVIDIDHFKRVNDTHGHLIGDEVLLLLARLMRGCFRYADRLYRFGGEEFLVLMHCGRAGDAARALERLRAEVAAYSFPRVGRITISVGFTEVRVGDTPSAAFERADQGVYHAKQHGRDQVVNHADLVAAGIAADEDKSGDVELF